MPPLNSFQKKCITLAIGQTLLTPVITQAGSITVNSPLDFDASQGCTLRNALAVINSGDPVNNTGCVVVGTLGSNDEINIDVQGTIELQSGFFSGTLTVTSTVSINGPGAELLTIDAGGESQVMNIDGAPGSTVDGLTLTGGRIAGGYNSPTVYGAGLLVQGSPNTVLSNINITNNTGEVNTYGGGLSINSSNGTRLESVSVTNNEARTNGGVHIMGSNDVVIVDSKISNNVADVDGISLGGFAGGVGLSRSSAKIENTMISGNYSYNGYSIAGGGGILVDFGSSLEVNKSTISNNQSNQGGGIFIDRSTEDTTITNSTISGNTTNLEYSSYNSVGGGGIFVAGGEQISLNNVTIIDNQAETNVQGGGIAINASVIPTFNMVNTVVANNIGDDCFFSDGNPILTGTNNWIGDSTCNFSALGDPLLGPLQDNGGFTLTHAPLPDSGLIGAGSLTACQSLANGVDQLNEPRGLNSLCTIGAVEASAQDPAPDSDAETIFTIPLPNGGNVIFGL